MSTTTETRTALDAIPLPAWATHGGTWDFDIDGTASRFVQFPLFADDPTLGALEALQRWNATTGQVKLDEPRINFGGLDDITDGDRSTLPDEARMLAARLLEAADRLEMSRNA